MKPPASKTLRERALEILSRAAVPPEQIPPPRKPARAVLRHGIWYADDCPCKSYTEALVRTLRAADIAAAKPRPLPERRAKKAKPHVPPPPAHLSPDARIVARGGAWFVDGQRYSSYSGAFTAALIKADGLPQPGNSERGSQLVAEAHLERARGAGA